MYHDRFQSLRHTWRCHEGDLVRAFRRLQDAGRVEVITSTATHAFFPLMDRNWANIRAQVHVAADLYETHFGRRPRGMWLGECGYVPGVDELLREAAIRYFFVDTHGILFADRRPVYGVYAPLYCPSGVAAFGRDIESSRAGVERQGRLPGRSRTTATSTATSASTCRSTTSSRTSTPKGTACTRASSTTRSPTTSCTTSGSTTRTSRAARRACTPRTSAATARSRCSTCAAHMDRPPIVVSPYDAELYGHWWYEGPLFLGDLFRQLHFDQNAIETITPGDYLDRHDTNQVATPCASSWGFKGYNDYWLNETNAWTYRHLHVAGERMVELARRHPSADPLTDARAQSGGARADAGAVERLDVHHEDRDHRPLRHQAHQPAHPAVQQDSTTTCAQQAAATVERARGSPTSRARDNIFPNIDYRIYAS